MTIIKQKAVVSERHAENVRHYLNGKDAVMRDCWNMVSLDRWYMQMAKVRKDFGHDKASRAGAKNTLMYHQVLAFLPEECSVNGGKMTPQLCMDFAMEYLGKRYPHQQVAIALHEESDESGKRFAVHMAINRSDLMTGKRLWEGTGKKGHHDRVATVREMDDEWGLQQVEEGKSNSLIRNRNPRDAERAIIEDDRYSYKNNIRRMVKAVLKLPSIRSMDDFIARMGKYGVEVEVKGKSILAADIDIREMGNPKCTFDLGKMDGNFNLTEVNKLFASKSTQSPKGSFDPKADYLERLDKVLAAYRELAAELGPNTPKIKIPKRPGEIVGDREVSEKVNVIAQRAEKIRSNAGVRGSGSGHVVAGRAKKGSGGGYQQRNRGRTQSITRKDNRGGSGRDESR